MILIVKILWKTFDRSPLMSNGLRTDSILSAHFPVFYAMVFCQCIVRHVKSESQSWERAKRLRNSSSLSWTRDRSIFWGATKPPRSVSSFLCVRQPFANPRFLSFFSRPLSRHRWLIRPTNQLVAGYSPDWFHLIVNNVNDVSGVESCKSWGQRRTLHKHNDPLNREERLTIVYPKGGRRESWLRIRKYSLILVP